jgi:hypothetical protein
MQKHEGRTDYTKYTHGIVSGFLSIGFGLGFVKNSKCCFAQKWSAISNAYGHMDKQSSLSIENKNREDIENDYRLVIHLMKWQQGVKLFKRHWLNKKFCTYHLHGSTWQQ